MKTSKSINQQSMNSVFTYTRIFRVFKTFKTGFRTFRPFNDLQEMFTTD